MQINHLSRQSCLIKRLCVLDGLMLGNSSCLWKNTHNKRLHTLIRKSDACCVREIREVYGRHGERNGIVQKQCRNYSQHSNGRQTFKHPWFGVFVCVLVIGGVLYKVNEDALKAKDEIQADTLENNDEKLVKKSGTISLDKAIEISRDLAQRVKDESSSPGLVIAVSVDGKTVWSEGMGYADVENRVPCTGQSVFRIASISKPITMAAVARLIESGDLDLDKPVQHYVPIFPEKTWNGKKVTITTRQLVGHLGGIRHYDKKYIKENNNDEKTTISSQSKSSTKQDQSTSSTKGDNKSNQPIVLESKEEMELKEYLIKKKFKTVEESLSLFKDDPLVHEPGTKFLYTTHGWTLISAVIEGITKTPFEKHVRSMLKDLGMDSTYLDENDPIIYHRGRHYMMDKKGRLINTPYVDLSYKWAGGGLASNIHDIVKFGNIMLYSYQATGNHGDKDGNENQLPGFLKPETMKMIFMPVEKAVMQSLSMPGERYAMGWCVWPKKQEFGCCREQRLLVSHSGAAIGGSSVLLIQPHESEELPTKGDNSKDTGKENGGSLPNGVVVAMMANMTAVGLTKTASEISEVFEKVDYV